MFLSAAVPRLLLALAGLAAGVQACADDAVAHAYRQHLERDGLGVEVWTLPGAPLEYEIEVRRSGDPAARLSGNGRGPLLASTLTDLDGDGQVEVLLLFDASDPRHALRLYEWNDLYLEAVVTAPPPAPPAPGAVRGQYRLVDDALLWEYARYAQASDPRPLERGAWRYDFAAGAWTPFAVAEGRASLLERLPFVGRDDAAAAAPASADADARPRRSLLSRLPFMGDDGAQAPPAGAADAIPAEAASATPARRSLLSRLPFVGGDAPGAGAPPAANADVAPAVPAETAGGPPEAPVRRSLLSRLPFVGDRDAEAPPAPDSTATPAAAPPATESGPPPAKQRSLLGRLPFVGDNDADDAPPAGDAREPDDAAAIFDAPAPVP